MSTVSVSLSAIEPISGSTAVSSEQEKQARLADRLSQQGIDPRQAAADQPIGPDAQPKEQEALAETRRQEQAQQAHAATNVFSKNIELDTETQAVIVQTVDEENGKVVRQYPSEVQLHLRAYLSASEPDQPAEEVAPKAVDHSV